MLAGLVLLVASACPGQSPPQPGDAGPLTIDLNDALARARKYGLQVQGAQLATALAHEDVKQAKAGRLPSLNAVNQFIYTEPNGTKHEYRPGDSLVLPIGYTGTWEMQGNYRELVVEMQKGR